MAHLIVPWLLGQTGSLSGLWHKCQASDPCQPQALHFRGCMLLCGGCRCCLSASAGLIRWRLTAACTTIIRKLYDTVEHGSCAVSKHKLRTAERTTHTHRRTQNTKLHRAFCWQERGWTNHGVCRCLQRGKYTQYTVWCMQFAMLALLQYVLVMFLEFM